MTEYKLITYGPDTWAKGTRGLLNGHATDKPRLTDARMYRDGSVGPRPQWTLNGTIDTSAMSGGAEPRWGLSNGRIVGIGDTYIELYGGDGSRQGRGDMPAALGGKSSRGPWNDLDRTNVLVGGLLFDTQPSGSLFVWPDLFSAVPLTITDVEDTLTSTFVGGAGFIDLSGSMIHQGRAFYWGPIGGVTGPGGFANNQSNFIYYSDPYAYDTFSADGLGGTTQFFEVDGEVAGCISIGSNLFIWTHQAEWFVLQGRGDPADGTLNTLGPGRIPKTNPARIDNGAIFMSSDRAALVNLSSSGQVDDLSLAYLADSRIPNVLLNAEPDAATDSVVNSIIVPSIDGARSNYNGVWTEEDWPFTEDFTILTDEASSTEYAIVFSGTTDLYDLYSRPSMLEEPELAVVEAGFTPEVVLPRVVVPGSQIRIRRVVVDVRTYDITDPAPSLTVSLVDGDNNAVVLTTGPGGSPFDGIADTEATYEVTATPEPQNFTHFSDITVEFNGLVIERVYVEMELNGDEPVLWP